MNDNRELKKFIFKDNKVLKGSVYLKKNQGKSIDRDNYMLEHMQDNLAFKEKLLKNNKCDSKRLLAEFQKEYKSYRFKWNSQPQNCIDKKFLGQELENENINPLCIDIEIAAICDLACPFCFREFLVTPDKIIEDKLCYDLIDQAAEMKVPSIKFNWRGEPLLNSKIFEYIKYAKKKGNL